MPSKRYCCCIAIASLLAGCGPPGPVRSHRLIGANAEDLRAAFNADSGRVRAIYLVAPT